MEWKHQAVLTINFILCTTLLLVQLIFFAVHAYMYWWCIPGLPLWPCPHKEELITWLTSQGTKEDQGLIERGHRQSHTHQNLNCWAACWDEQNKISSACQLPALGTGVDQVKQFRQASVWCSENAMRRCSPKIDHNLWRQSRDKFSQAFLSLIFPHKRGRPGDEAMYATLFFSDFTLGWWLFWRTRSIPPSTTCSYDWATPPKNPKPWCFCIKILL
jgi:hypothetical protein